MAFREITFREITDNPFSLIGDDWLLITAAAGEQSNTMTASWGGLGVLWNRPVAFTFLRPQRYTKEFVDAADGYSLCFFDGMREQLSYLGKVSGRDEDKIKKAGLTIGTENGIPYFKEARLVLFCQKKYRQRMSPEAMLDPALIEKFYPQNDFHEMYVGEITKILQSEDFNG